MLKIESAEEVALAIDAMLEDMRKEVGSVVEAVRKESPEGRAEFVKGLIALSAGLRQTADMFDHVVGGLR